MNWASEDQVSSGASEGSAECSVACTPEGQRRLEKAQLLKDFKVVTLGQLPQVGLNQTKTSDLAKLPNIRNVQVK